jgi:predicted TIM-barrel fold metal-dependent hydrolase
MNIIDFHTHLAEYWFENRLLSEAEFLDGLDRCGVEVACIFTLMGFYCDCPRENDALAEAARRHPTRFIPFVTVDPKLGAPAVEELERCLNSGIFRGVKFHPWCQAFAPSLLRATMIELLQCAARHDVPVIFHDGTPPYSTTFQIAALARWVPEAKIVLGHGGLSDYVYVAGQLLKKLPNLYVCCCGPKAGDVPYLVEQAGAGRVLFGSDYGVANWRLLAERKDDLLLSELPPDVLQKVFYGNAARLLHLETRPLASR